MFPPLCFIDISPNATSTNSNGNSPLVVPEESKEFLKDNLSDEEFALVSNNDENIGLNFKFKLLEFFSNNNLISKK